MQTSTGQDSPQTPLDPAFRRQLDGVFGYLLGALSPEALEAARKHDPGAERSWLPQRCLRIQIADQLTNTFRLQFRECPLREGMAVFRLYYRDDMADALAVAFFLHLQGRDPITALIADYSVPENGILTWESLDDLKADAEQNPMNAMSWNRIAPLVRPGDRLVRYRRQPSTGLILVRGDRRVWEEESYRFLSLGPSLRYQTDKQKFESLGGNRAFLAGEFDWPPLGWENPVTDAEEKAFFNEHRFGSR